LCISLGRAVTPLLSQRQWIDLPEVSRAGIR
jgi:hypothetical protein